MIDAAKRFGVLVGVASLGIILIWLGWQGNIGKGLAAFIAPGALEVIGSTGAKVSDGSPVEEPGIPHHSGG